MSKNIGYINLEKAVANNELKLYLSSDPKYTSKTIRGADVMNDFFDVTVALNDYGETHVGFDKIVHSVMMEILSENKIFWTYSVVNIINKQLQLEKRGKSKIDFIDERLLMAIKHAISTKKERLEQISDYEGALYTNGLMGAYEKIDQTVYENKGTKICGNLKKEHIDLI